MSIENPTKFNESGLRFPKLAVVWTALATILIFVLNNFSDYLNEEYNLNPGLPNILTIALVAVTMVVWVFWLAFFCGLHWIVRLMLTAIAVAGIVGFFACFRLVVDGDTKVTGIVPRFWAAEKTLATLENETAFVDLSVESERDFRQFLGNNRNGRVDGLVLDQDWAHRGPKRMWLREIGEGWSGFSAANGYAVTQEQRGQDECVTCYEIETGELVWIHKIPHRHEDKVSLGRVGPRATPLIHGGKVYAQGATGWLHCLDGANGEVIWKHDIASLLGISMVREKNSLGFEYEFENSNLAWGRSGSPVRYEDLVIVPGGQPLDADESGSTGATLIAFDLETGEERWRGGSEMISYGSPAIAFLVGQSQVVLVTESKAAGFDPRNGSLLWEHERPGETNAAANCSQVTLLPNNQVLLSKGYNLGGELLTLYRPQGAEQPIAVRSEWKNPRVLKTKFSNPVIRDEYAYSLSDGFLECTEIATGKRKWKKRGRFGNGQLLLVGESLLVHAEAGALFLIHASPDRYEEFGQVPTIKGICWNTICLYDRYLLVRSDQEAACFKLEVVEPEPGNVKTETAE